MGKNIAKEIIGAKFTAKEVKKLVNGARYINDRTNQSQVKVPFESTYGKLQGHYIAVADIKNMNARLNKYIKAKGVNPKYVNVIAESNKTGSTTGTTDTKGVIEKAFVAKMGNIKNMTEAITKTRSIGYDYYLNTFRNVGSGSLMKNISRLKEKAMNCVDYTCILANLAVEKGYQVKIIQIVCKTASHLLFKIKGFEFKDWTWVDIAAMASKTSDYCGIGKVCWCPNPNGKGVEIKDTNPRWYFNMFTDDLLITA